MKREILATIAALFLGSCIFSSRSFEPRPSRLNPESDAFADASLRTYAWKEGWTAGKRDTSLLPRSIRVQDQGYVLLHGDSLRRVTFTALDGGALPVSIATHLGFN